VIARILFTSDQTELLYSLQDEQNLPNGKTSFSSNKKIDQK
jgi:hypothetical protein